MAVRRLLFSLSLTQAHAHAHTPTCVCRGSNSCTSRHVHNRLEEFCVYSQNKKWARYVNIGLSDCRRTVAVIDFYKHPFRQTSELQEPPLDDVQHWHSSGRTDRLREKTGNRESVSTCENEARPHLLKSISWLIEIFFSNKCVHIFSLILTTMSI